MEIVSAIALVSLGLLALGPYILTIRDEWRRRQRAKFERMSQDALITYWKEVQERRESKFKDLQK